MAKGDSKLYIYELAERLVGAGAVRAFAQRDAAHIGVAASNGVHYLVTWNFRHIVNAVVRPGGRMTKRDRPKIARET